MVSVILPNYNHSKYLVQRIESILNQTYQDFELILLDDKSQDDSASILKSYAQHTKVSQIEINAVNSGSTFIQWQKGFQLAKGELVWIAESDDYCDPDFLQVMVAEFEKNNKLAFAYCTSTLVDSAAKLLARKDVAEKIPEKVFDGVEFIKKYMLSGNAVWNASAVVMRKDYALKANKQYMDYKSAGDHLFWVELAEMGQVVHVTKKMNYFRQHNNKVTPAKTKDGTTYKEENNIFNYIVNGHNISFAKRLYTKAYFIILILEGEFLNEDLRKDLLELWGYKKWMNLTILRIIRRVFR